MPNVTEKAGHDDLVRQVRSIGESIIKNAESIVGDEKLLTDLRISASVSVSGSYMPTIEVSREFLPEGYLEE